MKLRDDGFTPAIKLQVLMYPVMQGLNFQLPSMMQNKDGPLLTRASMTYFLGMHMEGNAQRQQIYLDNEHVSPSFKKTGMSHLDTDRLPKEYRKGYVKPNIETGDEAVWNDMKDRLLNPYWSPLTAESVENLPKTYLFTANFDPLRDEGVLYAIRLREAGNDITHVNSDIAIHGILSFVEEFEEAAVLFREMTTFILKNL